MARVVKKVFRVPLNAHHPLLTGAFNGLHKEVIIYRRHPQAMAKSFDGLAVNAVGADGGAVHQASQSAGMHQLDGLQGQQQRPVTGFHS